jgi:outer membrane protein assembly factor BamB
LWKVEVTGSGNSSPIVWGDRVFLTTSYDGGKRLSLLSYQRSNGQLLWETTIPQKGVEQVHDKNGHASATPVTDGKRVYASFGTHGLVAIDFDGNILWHRPLVALDNYHGSAGSPILYEGTVILYQDHQGQSFVAAFDKDTGDTEWRTDRSAKTGWGTPIVLRTKDRDELIVSSQNEVNAYDPASGKPLWLVKGNKFEVIPTPTVGHGLVFCSSGRAGPTLAIRPGGSGDVTETHVAWTSPKGSPFVPSTILAGDFLYMINDMVSVVTSYEAKTGKLMFQGRLGEAQREGFSASPVTVDGKIFFTNDNGETFVLEAGPELVLLHVNRLNARTLASPALVEGRWYFRTENELICIGK